jgi:hypothetical protein
MSFLRPITGSGTVMEPLPSTGSTSIIGVQWRVPVSCGAGLAIDDVAFAPPIP